MENRNYQPWIYFLAAALCVAAAYGSIIGKDYGIWDANMCVYDYGWTGKSYMTNVMTGGGRWTYPAIASASYKYQTDLGDLQLLRYLSLLFLSGLGAYFLSRSRAAGLSLFWGVACMAMLLINPGVAVFAFWAACFPFGLGMAIGLAGGVAWDRGPWRGYLSGQVLLQLSLAIYQPAAVCFLLPALLHPTGQTGKSGWGVLFKDRRFALLAGFGGGLGLHLAAFKLVNHFMLEGKGQQHRLLGDWGLIDRVEHFFTTLIPRVFTSWGSILEGPAGTLLWVLAATGVLLYIGGRLMATKGITAKVAEGVFFIGIAGGAFLPALVAADGYAVYRLLASTFAFVGVAAICGFRELGRFGALGRRSGYGLAVALVLLHVGMANLTLRKAVVEPRVRETAVIRDWFTQFGELPPGVTLRLPDPRIPVNEGVRMVDEYGFYETTKPPFAKYYITLIALEVFGLEKDDFTERTPMDAFDMIWRPHDARELPPVYPVLDLQPMLQGTEPGEIVFARGDPRVHPHVGEALYFEPGIWQSPWFGQFREEAWWVRHEDLGWGYWNSDPGADPIRFLSISGETRTFPKPTSK